MYKTSISVSLGAKDTCVGKGGPSRDGIISLPSSPSSDVVPGVVSEAALDEFNETRFHSFIHPRI